MDGISGVALWDVHKRNLITVYKLGWVRNLKIPQSLAVDSFTGTNSVAASMPLVSGYRHPYAG